MNEKYGIKKESDQFRLSKYDLNKLVDNFRNNRELKESQKEALATVAEPIDS